MKLPRWWVWPSLVIVTLVLVQVAKTHPNILPQTQEGAQASNQTNPKALVNVYGTVQSIHNSNSGDHTLKFQADDGVALTIYIPATWSHEIPYAGQRISVTGQASGGRLTIVDNEPSSILIQPPKAGEYTPARFKIRAYIKPLRRTSTGWFVELIRNHQHVANGWVSYDALAPVENLYGDGSTEPQFLIIGHYDPNGDMNIEEVQ